MKALSLNEMTLKLNHIIRNYYLITTICSPIVLLGGGFCVPSGRRTSSALQLLIGMLRLKLEWSEPTGTRISILPCALSTCKLTTIPDSCDLTRSNTKAPHISQSPPFSLKPIYSTWQHFKCEYMLSRSGRSLALHVFFCYDVLQHTASAFLSVLGVQKQYIKLIESIRITTKVNLQTCSFPPHVQIKVVILSDDFWLISSVLQDNKHSWSQCSLFFFFFFLLSTSFTVVAIILYCPLLCGRNTHSQTHNKPFCTLSEHLPIACPHFLLLSTFLISTVLNIFQL